MHQPAFGKKKWMGINHPRNHIPRFQLIQPDTTMVWLSMNPSGRHTMMVSSLMHPPTFSKKKWMGINCPLNHIPRIQLIQEETTMVWLSMNPSAFSKKNQLLLKQHCSHILQFRIVKMNRQISILQEWKEQQTIMTFTLMHPVAFSKRKGLSLHQPKNNFPRMMIHVSVKP